MMKSAAGCFGGKRACMFTLRCWGRKSERSVFSGAYAQCSFGQVMALCVVLCNLYRSHVPLGTPPYHCLRLILYMHTMIKTHWRHGKMSQHASGYKHS